tara:strand:+ start:299 stop:523 length:225 start_codon:yes stop_codon:yes gene_type:complete
MKNCKFCSTTRVILKFILPKFLYEFVMTKIIKRELKKEITKETHTKEEMEAMIRKMFTETCKDCNKNKAQSLTK